MIIEGVQCTDGTPLDLPIEQPKLIGYQIEHKETGRLLPGTNNFQVYGFVSATIKLLEVCEVYKIDLDDYNINPIYENEINDGYIIVLHPLDYLR